MKYKNSKKIFLQILFFLICPTIMLASEYKKHDHDHTHHKSMQFIANKGQWNTAIEYKSSIGGLNTIFLEKNGFTYLFVNDTDLQKVHDYLHYPYQKESKIKAHAYKVSFLNSNVNKIEGKEELIQKHNYFIGNDQTKWASNVPLYKAVEYKNLYTNIDLKSYQVDGHFKYDFIVKKGGSPTDILLSYKGVDGLSIRNGDLVIKTSVDEIIEYQPYAYQVINGKRIQVNCQYDLKGNTIQFAFPQGYNKAYELIIDPTVIAATLSGSQDYDNFGHSAAHDLIGNIYTGARNFGPGYPTTVGSFDLTFNGSSTTDLATTDIAISKYTPDGSQLIYATYIGGGNAEQPHSLITDADGQLYIYGTTNSSDYPITSDAYQTTLKGGNDIFITVLNNDGSQLVGSTYLGGSADDGKNGNPINSSYGDDFRGEIYIDNNRNIYIASNTQSDNFPTTENAIDKTFNTQGSPSQDAIVAKLNSNASYLYWSTLLGGEGTDTGMGIRVDNNRFVYVTGTAASANFPIENSTFNGGNTDAYVVKISPDGDEIVSGRFFGSEENDDSYFIDLDGDGNIHIYGVTTGNIPTTAGAYTNVPNSRQFLAAFSPDFQDIVYSTTIGNGPNSTNSSGYSNFDFVPVAFMVDKCNNIYFSGYVAVGDLPVTNNAFNSNLPGTFYLGVLGPNASELSFATYYGLSNHVDGGTSRFDRSGIVYQAVCSCGDKVMDTTPNAWATTQDLSTEFSCDIGVFKIDFDVPIITAFATVAPATSGCIPFSTNFTYTGKNATTFKWDFDNGQTSNQENPSMVFEEPGTYDVTLIASDPLACNLADTFLIQINVLDNNATRIDTTICSSGNEFFVNVTTVNAQYLWNDNSTSPTRSINTPGTYWVDVIVEGCIHRDSFIVAFAPPLEYTLGDDLVFCDAPLSFIDASAEGIVYYLWDDGSTSPTRDVTTDGSYHIYVENENGCFQRDTIEVSFGTIPFTDIGDSDTLCIGEQRTLVATNPLNLDVSYSWNNGSTADTSIITEAGTYYVTLDNKGCTFTDSVYMHYTTFEINYDLDAITCFDECDGAVTALPYGEAPPFNFLWENESSNAGLNNLCEGVYYLTVTDNAACEYFDSVALQAPDSLFFTTEKQHVRCYGDSNGIIQIKEIIGGTPPFLISYDNGATYLSASLQSNLNGGNYPIIIEDEYGCTARDTIFIYEPAATSIDAGLDQTIIMGESTKLEGQVYPLTNNDIKWLEADSLECAKCLNSTVDPTFTTLYTLSVTDSISGCELTDDVLITVDKQRNIYIPNVFSPNNDGTNDVFRVYTGTGVREITNMTVFDRWGEVIWKEENLLPKQEIGWDGSFKGKKMNPAVFVYLIEILFVDDEVKTYKGDVTLLK